MKTKEGEKKRQCLECGVDFAGAQVFDLCDLCMVDETQKTSQTVRAWCENERLVFAREEMERLVFAKEEMERQKDVMQEEIQGEIQRLQGRIYNCGNAASSMEIRFQNELKIQKATLIKHEDMITNMPIIMTKEKTQQKIRKLKKKNIKLENKNIKLKNKNIKLKKKVKKKCDLKKKNIKLKKKVKKKCDLKKKNIKLENKNRKLKKFFVLK